MDSMGGDETTNAAADAGEQPSSLVETSEGPASLNLAVGPPSPLTGCYLLIVIGDPYSHEHKDLILQKLLKGTCPLIFYYLIIIKCFSCFFYNSRKFEKTFKIYKKKSFNLKKVKKL